MTLDLLADASFPAADREASLELIKLDISRTFPNLCIFQQVGGGDLSFSSMFCLKFRDVKLHIIKFIIRFGKYLGILGGLQREGGSYVTTFRLLKIRVADAFEHIFDMAVFLLLRPVLPFLCNACMRSPGLVTPLGVEASHGGPCPVRPVRLLLPSSPGCHCDPPVAVFSSFVPPCPRRGSSFLRVRM